MQRRSMRYSQEISYFDDKTFQLSSDSSIEEVPVQAVDAVVGAVCMSWSHVASEHPRAAIATDKGACLLAVLSLFIYFV